MTNLRLTERGEEGQERRRGVVGEGRRDRRGEGEGRLIGSGGGGGEIEGEL